jgi:hypothetical protein
MYELENIIYNTNQDDQLVGGYPINKFISDNEMVNRMYYGGGNHISRFDDLVIPIGLITNKYSDVQNNHKIIKEEVVNTNLFNTLFDNICKKRTSYKSKKKLGSNKTKKNIK